MNLLCSSLRQLNITQENIKRKLDKERERNNFKTFYFFSLRQFNALQIKPLCFNCLTLKGYLNIHFHTFVLKKWIRVAILSTLYIKTWLLYIYIYDKIMLSLTRFTSPNFRR